MLQILPLRGAIQPYDWGSRTALAELLGRGCPSLRPEAELWLGAHPNGPAEVRVDGRWERLDVLIERSGDVLLGADAIGRFGRRLPFLLKVLAVERPLSLQAHPDAQRAAAAFEADRLREPALPRRYADSYPKPELVHALTPFAALCGFRAAEASRAWLAEAGLADAWPLDEGRPHDGALRSFLAAWLRQPAAQREERIAGLVAHAAARASGDPIAQRVTELAALWPGDPGLIAPVLMNAVALAPGEALFLRPGELHCYLSGVAVEIMAASDNVVRAGLTEKPVDVEELLAIAPCMPGPAPIVAPTERIAGETVFPTAAAEFELSRLEPEGREIPLRTRGPEVLLCTSGAVQLSSAAGGASLGQGASCLVPAAVLTYAVSGRGTLFRAALPAGDGSPAPR